MQYLQSALQKLIDMGTGFLFKLVACAVILFIGIKLIGWLIKKANNGRLLSRLDESLKRFLLSFIRISLYALLFVTIAGIVGVPMASFVTLLASAGVAIGLALQGALSNLAGGVMILIFKPFRVGDYIEVSEGSGTVTDITIIYTKLCTADNKLITIPNGSLTNAAVTNYSANDVRRVDIDFTASYSSDIDTVTRVMLDTAGASPLTLKEPAPFARLSSQQDSALCFTLRVWCKTSDYWNLYFDLQSDMKEAFDKNKIEIPFPQVDVNQRKQDS